MRQHGRGERVYTSRDFLNLGKPCSAVSKALSRLVVAKKIRRIGRGFYDLPSFNGILNKDVPANTDCILKAIQRRDKIARTLDCGMGAANRLNLTNAVPGQIIYSTSGRSKVVQVGRRKIQLQHIPKQYWMKDNDAARVVIALRWFGKHIATQDTNIEKKLKHHLSTKIKNLLIKDNSSLANLPNWMISVIRRATSDMTGA